MKLNALKFGIACGLATAILWVICSALVAILPGLMLSMSGHMVHMQLGQTGWHLTIAGFFGGLILWTAVAGISGWLLIAIYNRLV